MRALRWPVAAALVAVLMVPSAGLQAQAADTTTHYLAVTTFHVPFVTKDQQQVSWWIDSVMVPSTKMNPHVLSSRVGAHIYGSRGGDVILVTEYASWSAINAPCEPCMTWFQGRTPAEGTPARKAWDEAQATFLKYFTGHHDEIYAVDTRRSK